MDPTPRPVRRTEAYQVRFYNNAEGEAGGGAICEARPAAGFMPAGVASGGMA